MNYFKEKGYELKEKAKASGNLVSVDINNIHDLSTILAYFFYKKHHEWLAICFADEDFKTNKIWFNKGSDHTQVIHGLSKQKVLQYAMKFDSKYIIIAHNHPASSKFIPNYKFNSKRQNIKEMNQLQNSLQGFSNEDYKILNDYQNYFIDYNIAVSTVVFVAKNYTIEGDEEIINNYKNSKPINNKKNNYSNSKTTSEDEISGVILFMILAFLFSYFFFS